MWSSFAQGSQDRTLTGLLIYSSLLPRWDASVEELQSTFSLSVYIQGQGRTRAREPTPLPNMPSQQCRKRRRTPTTSAAAAVLLFSVLAAGGDSFATTSHAGTTAGRLSLKGEQYYVSSRTTTIGSGAKQTAFAWSGGFLAAGRSSLSVAGARSVAAEVGSSAATTTMAAGKTGKGGGSKTKPPSLPQVGVNVSAPFVGCF